MPIAAFHCAVSGDKCFGNPMVSAARRKLSLYLPPLTGRPFLLLACRQHDSLGTPQDIASSLSKKHNKPQKPRNLTVSHRFSGTVRQNSYGMYLVHAFICWYGVKGVYWYNEILRIWLSRFNAILHTASPLYLYRLCGRLIYGAAYRIYW